MLLFRIIRSLPFKNGHKLLLMKGLCNLTFSKDFRILTIQFFQIDHKRAKYDPNNVKKLFFSKIHKKSLAAGGFAPHPREIRDV